MSLTRAQIIEKRAADYNILIMARWKSVIIWAPITPGKPSFSCLLLYIIDARQNAARNAIRGMTIAELVLNQRNLLRWLQNPILQAGTGIKGRWLAIVCSEGLATIFPVKELVEDVGPRTFTCITSNISYDIFTVIIEITNFWHELLSCRSPRHEESKIRRDNRSS